MEMVFIVILIYCALFIFEFVPLYKQKLWRDFLVNALLAFLSFTMAILISLDVKIPSPEEPIREVITSIFGK